MKNNKLTIFLIILLSVIVILFSIFFVIILRHDNYNFFRHLSFNNQVSNELIFDETYEEIFDEIKIDAKASDVEIKEGLDNEVRVIIYGDEELTKVFIDNNKLDITSSSKSCIGFCFNFIIAKIEVYLPVDYDKSLTIKNNYGDIKISEFANMIVDLDIDAGDVNINSIAKATINNKYGDINISSYAKELNIIEDCGDVLVDKVDDIKVTNKYGDIKINQVNNSLDISDDCGDITIDTINIFENSVIKDSYGDIKIGKTNEIYIEYKTSLGDTSIKNNYPKSDITLTINNSCGDITVNN